MGNYFESGIGKAILHRESTDGFEIGRIAASEARSQIKQFEPALALVFTCPELDVPEVSRGVVEVFGDCPVIGSSTASEIANGFLRNSVVVAVLASPHISVHAGMGDGVSNDYKKAVLQALAEADVLDYFNSRNPQHQMLNMSAAGSPGISPVLLIVFSPGTTNSQLSLSHDIHSMLRKSSANRIPIFGGSSADYFKFGPNFQMLNDRISSDAVVLAFLETEILFGLGMSHGFSATKKRVIITRSTDHIIHEFDNRPAADAYAEMLGMPTDRIRDVLPTGPSPFNKFPFGSVDVYGNSLLHVPEHILEDGSIQFANLIGNNRVMTLMQATEEKAVQAGVSAYEKALHHGGLSKPSFMLMLSCALRLTDKDDQEEIRLVREKANIPLCGFYTYGEKGILDDGLPVYNNQSVSALVFSDELNPVASLILQGKKVYQEFTSRLDGKVSQINSIRKINQIIQDGSDVSRLLTALTDELSILFPWAHGSFYLATDESETFTMTSASDFDQFPRQTRATSNDSNNTIIHLDSHGKRFGVMVLKQKDGAPPPEEEDVVLAETIGKLTASGLQRIQLDGLLDIKLQQVEILNQLGSELSKSIDIRSQAQNILTHIRQILNLSFASLWLVDRTHHLLVKEAMDVKADLKIGTVEKQNDEYLATWQIEHQRPFFFKSEMVDQLPVELVRPFPFSFVSLPIDIKDQLRGVLNLYSEQQFKWSLQTERILQNMDFLQSLSTQIAIFIENRSLQKHATFYREMHHRVKNSLQNIASLLRMQIRRLDHVPAEQALSDSIARIMSIALVHDTLSQEGIGMVDLGRLVGSISKLMESGSSRNPIITLDASGPPIMIPSREATSLALVINELLQNAVQHSFQKTGKGKLFVQVVQKNGEVSVNVIDDGPGFPKHFDPEVDGNLGLTIVRTLVRDELKGRFEISSADGTCARVSFPRPEEHYPIG